MSENQPNNPASRLPPEMLARITNQRKLGEYEIAWLPKTGSSLHIIDDGSEPMIVRNGEFPNESMATWEFVCTYAHTLFPPDVAKKIFGVWGRPQVAPILDRGEGTRVYYRDGKAAAYSQIVGRDTFELAQSWNLEELLSDYLQQQVSFLTRETRWGDAVTYWLTRDVAEVVPELGGNDELMQFLEDYWAEFARLNVGQVKSYHLLRTKELTRREMDDDDSFHASLSLIETSHKITAYLRQKLAELEKNEPQTLNHLNKPVKELTLLLLHLHQTSTQQMILWWLGVAHGHLHLLNTVSRIPEDTETAPSPLETRIIDFDNSHVSVTKLAANDELYQFVNSEKVKQRITDPQLNINLRLQCVMYLPMTNWDEQIFELLEKHVDLPIVGRITELICLRAPKDITDPKMYKRFLSFIYHQEKESLSPYTYPAFHLTSLFLKQSPSKDDDPFWEVWHIYAQDGLEAVDLSSLDKDQKLLLLSAISHKIPYGRVALISRAEFEWALSLLDEPNLSKDHAGKLIEFVLDNHEETLSTTIFNEVLHGNTHSKELAQKILFFVYAQRSGFSMKFIQKDFIGKLYDAGTIQLALELLDFSSMASELADTLYRNLSETIDKHHRFDNDPAQKNLLLSTLKKRYQQSRTPTS